MKWNLLQIFKSHYPLVRIQSKLKGLAFAFTQHQLTQGFVKQTGDTKEVLSNIRLEGMSKSEILEEYTMAFNIKDEEGTSSFEGIGALVVKGTSNS